MDYLLFAAVVMPVYRDNKLASCVLGVKILVPIYFFNNIPSIIIYYVRGVLFMGESLGAGGNL